MSADAQHLTRARFAELAAVTAQRDELLDAAECVLSDWHAETGFVSAVRSTTGRPCHTPLNHRKDKDPIMNFQDPNSIEGPSVLEKAQQALKNHTDFNGHTMEGCELVINGPDAPYELPHSRGQFTIGASRTLVNEYAGLKLRMERLEQ